jgi:hypothetical protein
MSYAYAWYYDIYVIWSRMVGRAGRMECKVRLQLEGIVRRAYFARKPAETRENASTPGGRVRKICIYCINLGRTFPEYPRTSGYLFGNILNQNIDPEQDHLRSGRSRKRT